MTRSRALSHLLRTATALGGRSLSAAAAAAAAPPRKVAVLGAAGGIGQPLGLLMKVSGREREVWGGKAARSTLPIVAPAAARAMGAGPEHIPLGRTSLASLTHRLSTPTTQINPYVSELALYDIAGTPGVAADLSHINTKAVVKVSKEKGKSGVELGFFFQTRARLHMQSVCSSVQGG